MKQLLINLIKFQSDKSHPQEVKECFDFVVSELKKAGLKVKSYCSNNKWSLISAYKLKKHYQYILNGHLDVVPADYPLAFKPYVKGTKLYGRGASDMKGPVAAMIELIRNPELKNVDLALMLTTDEEVGGLDGVNFLVNSKNYTCDCAIIPDGGDNWHLTLAEKGVLHLKITAFGKSAHGSRPWLGDNALEKLISMYRSIEKQIPKTSPKNRWKITLNLGKIQGGKATNIVPDRGEMYLDFRFPKKGQDQWILKLIKKYQSKFKDINYQILAQGDILQVDSTNKYLKKLLKVSKKQGIHLKKEKTHGASDARFFASKRIPVAIFKPICSEPHIENEWIDLKSLGKFQQILKSFLTCDLNLTPGV